jgi:hypothetical protein
MSSILDSVYTPLPSRNLALYLLGTATDDCDYAYLDSYFYSVYSIFIHLLWSSLIQQTLLPLLNGTFRCALLNF